jgi:methyl-accepting chemotaxis protein
MKKLTIAHKLILLVGALLVCLMAVNVTGVIRLQQIRHEITLIRDDLWPKVLLMGEGLAGVNQISISGRDLVLARTPEEAQLAEASILEGREVIGKAWSALAPRLSRTEGKEMLKLILESRERYIGAQNALIALIEAGRREEATTWLHGEYLTAAKEYAPRVNNLVQFQGELLDESTRSASSIVADALLLMLILGGIAILVGIVAAMHIARDLLRQLGGEPNYAADVATQVAKGDMTVQIHLRSGDTNSLLAEMKNMVRKLSETLGDVRSTADSLATVSENVSITSQKVARGSSEQAASLEETATSLEHMSALIRQNTENAKVVDFVASKAVGKTAESRQTLRATVEALRTAADKIRIVDEIAYETNLLAADAASGALRARKHDHDQDFAIVAVRIRKLAERSQTAVLEMNQLTGTSVKITEKVCVLLDEILPAIRRTAELVQEITSASERQSTGVDQISAGMTQISQTTKHNASASEALSATAEEMNTQAEQLRALVAQFRLNTVGRHCHVSADSGKPETLSALTPLNEGQTTAPPLCSTPVFATANSDTECTRM